MKITSSHRSPRNTRDQKGLTLIELLVTVAIIGVLATIGGSVFAGASDKAAMMREINGAKNLLAAFSAYAVDNNGELLRGYDESAEEITLPDGETVGRSSTSSYPYRLASYFNYQMEGVVLINKNIAQVANAGGGSYASQAYVTSRLPALGMNYIFVGGNYLGQNGSVLQVPDEVATRQVHGGSLLVFASAAGNHDGARYDGYAKIVSPYVGVKDNNWGTRAGTWSKSSAPEDFGHIDPRYGGKAVCAFLDGTVKMMSITELNDMRLWSKNAVAENNPSYKIPAPSGGGGRGR